MALVFEETELKRPIQPNDYQVQRSSLMDIRDAMLRQAVVETKREQPGKAFNGYHYEIVTDGAGTKHHNLTVYFMDDVPTPALDHRNLNGAEQAVFGQVLSHDDLLEKGIGQKDQKL